MLASNHPAPALDPKPMTMASEAFALGHYEREDVARIYGRRQDLFPAEKTLFEVHRERVAGRRVLDLGCGGGRTTPWLHALAAEYIGVDYSAKMIEICRARYPEVAFEQGDATNLTSFGDASFDFVLFSYNGIDTMSHAPRLQVLAEVRRVLRADGWFVFSSHNIDYRDIVVAFDPSAPLTPEGLRRNFKYLRSYLRVRRYQIRTATYAVLSDPRAGRRQLTYYISKPNQIAQLRAAGFVDTEILSWDGRWVTADEPDRDSISFYYICRKPTDRPLPDPAAGPGG
jgi:ubiquinone/menaquinone biosynthesis C-methylase UbiE